MMRVGMVTKMAVRCTSNLSEAVDVRCRRRENERPVGRAQRDTGVLGLADIC